MSDVLVAEGVTKRFRTLTANDAVSVRVRAGEVVGLLGHNGAGKTTLVSQVVGLLRPDAGTIRVGAVDAVADPAAARRLVSLQAQAQAPIDGLTPRTAIEIAGRIRGLTPRRSRAATESVAQELEITEWIDQRALPEGRGLSGGVRRLTAFAMAVVAPTPLVVLDEPTNDVDAARRRRLWGVVRRLADQGSGVLLVTHNVVEAERLVDELVVLDRGRVVASGSPAQLRDADDADLRLELRLHPHGDDPSASGTPPVPVHRRVRSGRRVLLTVPTDAAAGAVEWATALRHGDRIDGFALAPATLEDTYLALTERPANEPTTTSSDQEVIEEPTRV